MTHNDQVHAFIQALRQPYAWPGGYSVRIYLSDGECICHQCARKNAFQIGRATRDGERNGWAFLVADVRWEGPDEYCCNCYTAMPSEYGDPDATEEE